MIKKIMHNGEVIAIVFKEEPNDVKGGINFFTSPENSLQTGILNHPKDHIIPPHIHNKVERRIVDTQEMLYLERGKMKVSFYTEENKKIGEETMVPGNLVLLMKKGHGFEMLEDSKLVYVKQGPYVNKETDKKVFSK